MRGVGGAVAHPGHRPTEETQTPVAADVLRYDLSLCFTRHAAIVQGFFFAPSPSLICRLSNGSRSFTLSISSWFVFASAADRNFSYDASASGYSPR